MTPLFNACSRGSAACAELLLQYGAKAQWESCLPSPTHEAASRGKELPPQKHMEQLSNVSVRGLRNVWGFVHERAY